MEKMNLEELAIEANKILSEKNINLKDSRYSSNISERRIRDYLSKGLIDKPFKEGKKSFYTDNHLQQLISLREIQSLGLSDSYIQSTIQPNITENINNEFKNDFDKHDLLNTINEINIKRNYKTLESLTKTSLPYTKKDIIKEEYNVFYLNSEKTISLHFNINDINNLNENEILENVQTIIKKIKGDLT